MRWPWWWPWQKVEPEPVAIKVMRPGASPWAEYKPFGLPCLEEAVERMGNVEHLLSESRKAIMLGERQDPERYEALLAEQRRRLARATWSLDEIDRTLANRKAREEIR